MLSGFFHTHKFHEFQVLPRFVTGLRAYFEKRSVVDIQMENGHHRWYGGAITAHTTRPPPCKKATVFAMACSAVKTSDSPGIQGMSCTVRKQGASSCRAMTSSSLVVIREQYGDVETVSRSNTRSGEFLRQHNPGVYATARRTSFRRGGEVQTT
jgi:hypothetical protein